MSSIVALLVMLAFASIYAALAAMLEARGPELAAALSGERRHSGGTTSAPRSRAFSLA